MAACETRHPDAVLLDVNLPRLGGQAFAMQAAVYLSKPFELEKLLSAVKRVLRPAPA